MVLMAVDHASDVFNNEIVAQDAAAWGALGADLTPYGGPWPFMTRWITHLCAPTFLFLAGTALALSVERRVARGASAWSIDRHLIARGLVLILLELWMAVGFQTIAQQVLFAIGGSLLCMVFLRRLPSWALLTLGLGWMVLGERCVELLGVTGQLGWETVLMVPGFKPLTSEPRLWGFFMPWFVGPYPLLPWLAILLVGWVFGRWLLAAGEGAERRTARLLLSWAAVGLAVFVLQRSLDGPDGFYGNYSLARTDDTWLRWLQVSKYPASLAFSALELGLMALLLAGFFLWQGRGAPPGRRQALLVFGQCALFFYVLHMHVMSAFAWVVWGKLFGQPAPFGVAGAWLGALGVLIVLYPVCLWFRAQREANPGGWTRWL